MTGVPVATELDDTVHEVTPAPAGLLMAIAFHGPQLLPSLISVIVPAMAALLSAQTRMYLTPVVVKV